MQTTAVFSAISSGLTNSAFEDTPFFSYRVKIATQTGSIHEFGMQYDIYTNPDFTDIF